MITNLRGGFRLWRIAKPPAEWKGLGIKLDCETLIRTLQTPVPHGSRDRLRARSSPNSTRDTDYWPELPDENNALSAVQRGAALGAIHRSTLLEETFPEN